MSPGAAIRGDTGRGPVNSGVDRRGAGPSQGRIAAAGSRERGKEEPSSGGNKPANTLILPFCPRIMREYILLFKATQFVVIC